MWLRGWLLDAGRPRRIGRQLRSLLRLAVTILRLAVDPNIS
jgi:hypothetical protein